MFSVDVDSRFNNVPLYEIVGYLCDTFSTVKITLSDPVAHVKDLILFCTYCLILKDRLMALWWVNLLDSQ